MRFFWLFVAFVTPVAASAQVTIQNAILEPSRFVEIRTVVNGRIAELPVEEGQRIAAGVVVAGIDAAVQAQRVELAKVVSESTGNIRKSEEALDMAVRVGARVAEARTKGAAQPWEVERAEQAVAMAEADKQIALDEHASSLAQLELEQAMLNEFSIRAPFDATVLQIFKEVGEIVTTEEDVIMEIGDLETLRATMFVPEDQADTLETGQTLRASYGDAGGPPVEAGVIIIDPRMDPVSRTVRVVLELDNSGHALRVGTSLQVELP